MRIGVIKEGKEPADERTPFTPEQCELIKVRYPQVDLFVQKSDVRAFRDSEYIDRDIEVVNNIQQAEVIFGVKEVRLEDLLEDKTYFFFSHTIKKQPYNRELLQTILQRNIKLIDYECLTDQHGSRILGFGRYAGIVGCYNAFLAFGERSGNYTLKPAYKCEDRKEMESYLPKVKLPNQYKIVLTGGGRVANGAKEILAQLGIKKVSPEEFLNNKFEEAVYTQIEIDHYFRKKDGNSFKQEEAYDFPERFESNFILYGKVADMLITGHYWDANGPKIITQEDMASDAFKIRTIADISCDIDGPIPSTIRPATIEDPIYHINKTTLKEVTESKADNITVMAVDNLPCELPRDASSDFGDELINKVLPNLIRRDDKAIIERATIAQAGELMPEFNYLQDYVDGKE